MFNLLRSILVASILFLTTPVLAGTPASIGYPWAPYQTSGGLAFGPQGKKFIGTKNDGSPGNTVGFVNDWFGNASESLLWNSDGSFTFLSAINASQFILSSTFAGLPAPNPLNPGAMRQLTDNIGGIWIDTGTQWRPISGGVVDVTLAPFNTVVDGIADTTASIGTADTAAVAGTTSLLFPPGTYRVSGNITIASPSHFLPNSLLKPDAGVAIVLSTCPKGPTFRQPIFDVSAAGSSVTITPPCIVVADWWGGGIANNGRATQAVPGNTIQRSLNGTAPGSDILLSGIYYTTAISAIFDQGFPDDITKNRDVGKTLRGVGSNSFNTAILNKDWGAEIFLGNTQNANLFSLLGQPTGGFFSQAMFTFDNIKLSGNKANNLVSGHCLYMEYVGHIRITSLLIELCKQDGMSGVTGRQINGINADYIEILSCDGHGMDLGPSAGDIQLGRLRIGANGLSGVVLQGGYQIDQIRTFINGVLGCTPGPCTAPIGDRAGVLFLDATERVSINTVVTNDNKGEGVLYSGPAGTNSNTWIGTVQAEQNGGDAAAVASSRSQVHIKELASGHIIESLQTKNASGSAQYDIYLERTGGNRGLRINSYMGSGAAVQNVFGLNATARQLNDFVGQPPAQIIGYAANITPDPFTGEIIKVGQLTGDININAVDITKRIEGTRMQVRIVQDGAVVRAVNWDGASYTVKSAVTAVLGGTSVFNLKVIADKFVELVP